MLVHLLIQNYALIEHLELSPPQGLTIITGETGAGKSIMLGAMGLLMGNRADPKVLFDPARKCIIEGVFDVTGYALESQFEEEELDFSDQCILRREISPNGKSRAFINDTPVTLDTLKKLSAQLIDIHSQHDSILLGTNEFQLGIIDTFAGAGPLLDVFRKDYQAFRKAEQELQLLKAESARIKKEFDYHRFLLDELSAADPKTGEQQALEHEQVLLENAAEIKSRLQAAWNCLDNPEQSVLILMREALQQIGQIQKLHPAFQPLQERLQSSLIELRDISSEIEDRFTDMEVNDDRLDRINERLNLLYQLLKKHQAGDPDELIAIRAQLQAQVDRAVNLDAELEKAQETAEQARERMNRSAAALSDARKGVVSSLEQEITVKVKELGIPDARFSVSITEGTLSRNGKDHVAFLFSANKGIAPQELRQVASGGEFSRLMLVIKYIMAGKRQLPTIILDEIDTGISGEIAVKMGELIQQMSRKHQLMAITHLHQIAARGQTHYYVFKDNSREKTVSRIKTLTTEERIRELAHMIGGQHPSASVLTNARELLEKSV